MKREAKTPPPIPAQCVIDLWAAQDILAGLFYDFTSSGYRVITPTAEDAERVRRGELKAMLWAEPLILALAAGEEEWPAAPDLEWAASYAASHPALEPDLRSG
jgi:hypothetical protein